MGRPYHSATTGRRAWTGCHRPCPTAWSRRSSWRPTGSPRCHPMACPQRRRRCPRRRTCPQRPVVCLQRRRACLRRRRSEPRRQRPGKRLRCPRASPRGPRRDRWRVHGRWSRGAIPIPGGPSAALPPLRRRCGANPQCRGPRPCRRARHPNPPPRAGADCPHPSPPPGDARRPRPSRAPQRRRGHGRTPAAVVTNPRCAAAGRRAQGPGLRAVAGRPRRRTRPRAPRAGRRRRRRSQGDRRAGRGTWRSPRGGSSAEHGHGSPVCGRGGSHPRRSAPGGGRPRFAAIRPSGRHHRR